MWRETALRLMQAAEAAVAARKGARARGGKLKWLLEKVCDESSEAAIVNWTARKGGDEATRLQAWLQFVRRPENGLCSCARAVPGARAWTKPPEERLWNQIQKRAKAKASTCTERGT
eukprot:1782542-Prymnesium_polylepis.1